MKKNIEKILYRCFNPKKGKPNLLKRKSNINRVKQHLDKARNNLRAMEIMFEKDFFDWTIICGYYAMYHAVLASLFKIGITAKTHYCAIAAFKKFYVKRGEIKPEYIDYIQKAKQLKQKYADSLERAQESRVIEQYGVEVISNDDAEWIIEDSKDFVLKI